MLSSIDLREIISSEMSRKNTDYVKEIILKQPSLFSKLFKLVLLNEEPVSRRAIWVLDAVSEINPDQMKPYIEQLMDNIQLFKHDGLKRHSLRILSRFKIPTNREVELLDICYGYLLSEKESIAVRYYAMEILYSMTEKEKDLKYEFSSVLEMLHEEKSPGLKNHIRKLFEKLKKEIKIYEQVKPK